MTEYLKLKSKHFCKLKSEIQSKTETQKFHGKMLKVLSLFANGYLPYTTENHVESCNKKIPMKVVKYFLKQVEYLTDC